jgi:hypothetical protein
MEDEFVETCVAMLVYARTRTAAPHPQFDLFSPWNEPEFATLGEGIDTTGAQRASILHKLVLRMSAIPELTGIQLSVGEDGSEPGMIITRQAVASDSLVMDRTAATSFHRYSDGNPQVFGDWRGASPPVWLTELNSTWLSACYETTFGMGLEAAGNLLNALKNGATAGLGWSEVDAPHRHQADSWQAFGLLTTTMGGKSGTQLCSFSGQPSDAVLDATTYSPKPTYYALRHIVKWIRPNASPIAMTASGGISAVGYLNADGTVAVAGVNNGAAVNSTITLTMPNPPSYLTPRITTATTTDVVGSPVALTSGQGVFALPGSSVFTLLSSPGSGSGGTGGSGGQGGMPSGGNAGAGGQGAGNGGVSGDGTAGASSGAPSGGQSGSSGTASGAGGQSSGGAGQGGAGTSSGGAGAGGAAAGMAGASGSGGSGLPQLVAGWAFNEGSGSTTADASGHGHTGTLVSSPVWTTASGCKYGACLAFSGTGKRVTTPDANDLDLNQTFTVMGWVNPSSVSGWRPLLIKEEAGGLVYLLYAAGESVGTGKSAWLDIGGSDLELPSSGALPLNTWSHVALERNGGTVTYWTNGLQTGSTTVSGNTTASTGVLAIGGHSFWGGEWFAGKIDDVRIYSAALTGAQISTAMSAGL